MFSKEIRNAIKMLDIYSGLFKNFLASFFDVGLIR